MRFPSCEVNAEGDSLFVEPTKNEIVSQRGVLFMSALNRKTLKVPKCEIFDRWDFHYFFYNIWSLGDLGTKL